MRVDAAACLGLYRIELQQLEVCYYQLNLNETTAADHGYAGVSILAAKQACSTKSLKSSPPYGTTPT